MKNHPVRKVSFAKDVTFESKKEFTEAFPHLTSEEIDHYFPKVSKSVSPSATGKASPPGDKEAETAVAAKKKD